MKRLVVVIMVCGLTACAHHHATRGSGSQNIREQLGYLQLKTQYADAAWNEGNIGGVKKALDNRHSKTGKPYPCWNALKPFKGKNLPVSLVAEDRGDPNFGEIIRIGQLPAEKLDRAGKDGGFSREMPTAKSGFTIWKVDKIYQKANRKIGGSVIGLVDISESMKAGAKFRTLMGLKDSNIRFQKIYLFSEPGSLAEVALGDVSRQSPKGRTAIYDNLKTLVSQYPGAEIIVVTDGKDNRSKSTLDEVETMASQSGTVIDVVLTGKSVSDKVAELARKTGGQVMRDVQETGEVIQPVLDVSVIR